MAIFEEVKDIIVKYIKIDKDKITLDSKLNEDLDADSIDIADVVMDIEEKYGFEFSDEDAENITEIKDLVKVIEERK
ncbi:MULTISPECIES: acyl carrier protein [Gemella]|uniref:acyl carrier protein n=1 Tax=Gemella TaxID=1378 RepID=UPI000767E21D|nr:MULTISPECIES: acyl carrier protein [Gemella]AME09769.1 acyl carrier protein [Gemella sp. oral taxon 928]AXI27368.1 acyl carrier protein [Gemella sp. ND 6198]